MMVMVMMMMMAASMAASSASNATLCVCLSVCSLTQTEIRARMDWRLSWETWRKCHWLLQRWLHFEARKMENLKQREAKRKKSKI